jgi:6-pyruvoyltetrahydropterin/6-carboxytetrahydropterin synthase
MRTKIAKEFHWEMSHRLPFHEGECRNIHGHTYKLLVEIQGEVNGNGMLMDYYDIKKLVNPLIQKLDHAFICDESDTLMLDFITKNNFKHFVIKNYTTSENLADFFLHTLAEDFRKFPNIEILKVRLYETSDAFAEAEMKL